MPTKVATGKTRAELIKECDTLWSKIVRKKDHVCIWCRIRAAIHAHHIFARNYAPTRHVILNGAALCAGCHTKAHSHREEFIEFIKSKMSAETWEALYLMARINKMNINYGLVLLGLMEEWDKLNKKDFDYGGLG